MGASIGSFEYIPPEQIGRAKTVDSRADLYAAATVLFHALTGQLPFLAGNALVLAQMKSSQAPRTLSETLGKTPPPALDAFFSRALSRSPEARFPSAREALQAWRDLA